MTLVRPAGASAEDPTAPAPASPAPPTSPPPSLTPVLQRLLGPEVTNESCRRLAIVRGEERYACSMTECPGACRVVHLEVVVGVRRGRGRVISRTRRDVGDTGECGCCTEVF